MGRTVKVLIAITCCHHRYAKADLLRELWTRNVEGADVRFFYGRGGYLKPLDDEVYLDCRDDYDGLTNKSKAIYSWALEHGYDYVFDVDDDTYVRPALLLASGFEKYDYIGRLSTLGVIYASGGPGIWLSKKALEILAVAPENDTVDDRWIGNTLAQHGIRLQHDLRYCVSRNWLKYEKTFISVCSEQYAEVDLRLVHDATRTRIVRLH